MGEFFSFFAQISILYYEIGKGLLKLFVKNEIPAFLSTIVGYLITGLVFYLIFILNDWDLGVYFWFAAIGGISTILGVFFNDNY